MTKNNKSAPADRPRRRKRYYVILPAMYIALILSAIMYVAARYKREHFGDAKIDEIIFYFMNGIGDGQSLSLWQATQENLLLISVLSLLVLIPVIDFFRRRIHIHFDLSLLGRARKIRIDPSRVPMWFKLTYTVVLFTLSAWYFLSSFGVGDYLRALAQSSQLFEDSYVDPAGVALDFPDQPRNLVYIYLESMENTVASKSAGGQTRTSLIPELERMALDDDNVSFSHVPAGQGLGGPLPAHGTTWTVAGMTAQSGGIPLKANILGRDENAMGEFNEFLPGATTLGDILQDQGYNQSFVMGSNATFGGRDKLLRQHGNYHIIDLKFARENGLVPSDYHVWWGYEDRRLFEFARAEATRLSQLDKPFNLQMLTVDTHFSDGYLDPTCPTPHAEQYDNVHACSSARVAEFVSWLQAQPFADNTTIIIAGDHLGMQTAYYDAMMTPGYTRTGYNVIINAAADQPARTHERLFTTFDMFPTTLAAMGVDIPGDQLALGVNLFADRQTLLEQYGSIDAFNDVLSQRSHFYERQIRIAP